MNQLCRATAALFLLAGMGCLGEGVPHSRDHHIIQFRKLNMLISSDASTSQNFGDAIFENSALAPEGDLEAETSPGPSTEGGILVPAVSPENAPEESPVESPAGSPGESPQDAVSEAPAEAPAESPEESAAEVPETSLDTPEEAPAQAPDAIALLEKDLPELFPASAPDIEIDLDELSRQQLLNTSRNFIESELDKENAAGRKSGAGLGTLIAFVLACAVLP